MHLGARTSPVVRERDRSIALFVALGGASYAAISLQKGSVGSAQLKNNAVTGAKIRAAAVTGSEVEDESLSEEDFDGGFPKCGDVRYEVTSAASIAPVRMSSRRLFAMPAGAGPWRFPTVPPACRTAHEGDSDEHRDVRAGGDRLGCDHRRLHGPPDRFCGARSSVMLLAHPAARAHPSLRLRPAILARPADPRAPERRPSRTRQACA